jgi:2-keto-3-deoxy-galactonokinase
LAFDAACGDWLDAQPGLPVIACGMVGSAQGWSEAAYRNTPADVASLGQALHTVRSLRGVDVHIVPGVIEQVGLPNVMRGEETQVLGVLQNLSASGEFLIGLPGSHSKWVEVVDGCITHFDTFMTGELFAVLSQHSILGRTQRSAGQFEADAFDRGVQVALSADGQRGVLSTLFSARTLGLTGELAPDQQPDYLSGLLIGHELAGLPGAAKHKPIILIGARRSVPVTNAPSVLRLRPRQPGARGHRTRPLATGAGRRALNLQRRPDMLKQALAQNGLIAILRGVRPDEARRSAKSCTAGFRVIEVPLNSPDPYKASASCDSLPADCLIGAGTVLTPEQVEQVKAPPAAR